MTKEDYELFENIDEHDIEKKWNILGKNITFISIESYSRSPHWCNTGSIEFYFENEAGKGYFHHEIFLADSNIDENLRLNYEQYIARWKELTIYIIDSFDCISSGKPVDIDISDEVKREIAFCIFEGIKGATEEEKKKYKEDIEEHNRKCEEFHKENPHFYTACLLKPGLASIFSAEYPDSWKSILEIK